MTYPLKICPNASGCHAKKPEVGECLNKRRNAFKRKQKQTNKKLFVNLGFLIFQFRDRSNPLNNGSMYRTKHRAGESWEESGPERPKVTWQKGLRRAVNIIFSS